MPLKLLYITNEPQIAKIAEENGVDRIMVDMEYIGKDKRQGGLDSVKNTTQRRTSVRSGRPSQHRSWWFGSIRSTRPARNTAPRKRKSMEPFAAERMFLCCRILRQPRK